MTATVQLLEYANSAGRKLTVDRENGVIKRVKVLGESSQNPPPNNNLYPPQTRQNAAARIEGARVYVDHAPEGQKGKTRSYRDALGVHKNVQEEGDGLYADFHFNPKHELAEQLCWDALNAPERVGFSISSNGVGQYRDGKHIIEEILFDPYKDSVDLVSRPATTRGLNESLTEPPMKKKVSVLIEELKATRPGWVKALREEAEAGILSPDTGMEPPAAAATVSDKADHEAALEAGFRAAWAAIFDDASLDMKGKLQKAKDLLNGMGKLLGNGESVGGNGVGGSGSSEGNGNGGGVGESRQDQLTPAGQVKLEEELATMKARDLLRSVADEAGVKVSRALLETIRPNITEAQVKALVESLKPPAAPPPAPGTQQPRSAAPWTDPLNPPKTNGTNGAGSATPVQESQEPAAFTDEDRKKRVNALRSIR